MQRELFESYIIHATTGSRFQSISSYLKRSGEDDKYDDAKVEQKWQIWMVAFRAFLSIEDENIVKFEQKIAEYVDAYQCNNNNNPLNSFEIQELCDMWMACWDANVH
jgi:hypothetical protein